MKRVLNVLKVAASVIFCVVLAAILVSSFFANGGEYSFYNSPNIIATILLAVVIFAITFVSYTLLIKRKKALSFRKELLIVGAIMIIFFIALLFIGKILAVTYSWDPNELYWPVSSILEGRGIDNIDYLSHYPFQLMLVNLSVAFMAVVRFFGLALSVHAMWTALNIILIWGSLLIVYLILRKIFNARIGIFGLILTGLFTPILLYAPIPYTDTFSMPFILLSFYLFLWLIDGKVKIRTRLILCVPFAISAFLAFNLKATAGVLLVAILIYCWLTYDKKYLKLFFAFIGVCALVVIPLTAIYKYEQSQLLDPKLTVPTTHWVMMGLNDGEFAGGWNKEDWSRTYDSMYAGRDMSSEHIEEIKNRLNSYGPINYMGFLAKKIAYTWGDGTYTVSDQLNKIPSHPDSLLYHIVAKDGRYNDMYITFAHAMQVFMLATFLWGGCITIRDRSFALILKITIVGIFLFFLIWETTSRYLLNYLPLFVVLTVYMVDSLVKKYQKKLKFLL